MGKSSLISDLIHEGFQPTVQAVLPIVVLPPEGTFGFVRPHMPLPSARALASCRRPCPSSLCAPLLPRRRLTATGTSDGDPGRAAVGRLYSHCSPTCACHLHWLALFIHLFAVILSVL